MAQGSDEATVDAGGQSMAGVASRGTATLVFIGPNLVQSVTLHEGAPLLVGRQPPADVVLNDPTVSRQHARVALERGQLSIEDAGSHNGVVVNGEVVRRTLASAGDRVRIGAIEVMFWNGVRVVERDLRELSALHFVARLSEELERVRYSQRPVWLCAMRWGEKQQPLERLGHAHGALRTIDRFCVHAPHITLALLFECDEAQARATIDAVRQRAGSPSVVALASAPPHASSAEAMIAAVVDRVQGEGPEVRVVADEPNPAPAPADDASVVIGAQTRRLFELAARTGHADLPVLVVGETGAGKEIVARAFHEHSRRGRGPFCEINCAAIAATLVDSVLFGYEKGAFTGAAQRTPGLFEQAHGGSLFLDEVAELSAGAQSALLRVLESKRVRRLGATKEVAVDVRVIAATNRDLRDLVAKGQFREDLLYRLAALTVRVPALRERTDEIEPLVELFLREAAAKWGAPARVMSEAAHRALSAYDWPGNVRQLRNAVERAVAVCAGPVIELDDLPEHLSDAPIAEPLASNRAASADSLPSRVRAFEIARIREALAQAGGNRSAAARLLGLPRRTLGSKLREYELE